jgi:cell fate regulator YaaT (PSP1 superfamily)
MTFDNGNTVQSATSAAASFIETLGRKANIVSPRTDEHETSFLTPSTVEGNGHNTRSQRANSIVTSASPFVSSSSLWTASTSYESLTDNSNLLEPTASSTGSLWETPRRSSVSGLSNWKCVGSAASMLQDTTARLQDLLGENNASEQISASSSSITVQRPSFAASFSSHNETTPSDCEGQQQQKQLYNSNSRPTSPLNISRAHFMQLPALLHEEIGIESAEEAAEIFKRSSMDSLLDFDPTSLFSSLNSKVTSSTSDLKGSTLMSALSSSANNGSTNDFRRHSFNWLSSGSASYESFGPSNFTVKPIAEVSIPSSRASSPAVSTPRGSPSLDSFPEEFIFAPSSSIAQFSKKRFARRHSIAADGVAALEDSFAQSLNFGNPADTAEFIPSSHFNMNGPYYNNLGSTEEYQPITGNIYAAYAGLLGEDFAPEPSGSEMNTFLNSMRSNGSHCSMMFNHQMPVSFTPAQAGINPTVLSFPNANFHLPSHKGPLYLIEFKSGRTEIFFVVDLDTVLKVKIGDLVIVEADRGEDFGRITGEIPISKIRQLMSQLPHDYHSHHNNHSSSSHAHHSNSSDDVYGSNGNVNHNLAGLAENDIASLLSSKEIVPKRIHRHATSLDMKFLQAKAQEEAFAMSRCQSRIRQKKLPMEVVDAEYQWDRNKLTFYFSADRRIDFRELVRDLFRIYKTRIWMCAVDKNRANLLNSLANNSN